jgi:hypothetical protein
MTEFTYATSGPRLEFDGMLAALIQAVYDACEKAINDDAPMPGIDDVGIEEGKAVQRWAFDMEQRKDAAYLERNQVVAALAKCFPSGIARTAIEGWSEDWHGCVYIDLPTGQASWHFHDSHAYLFVGLPAYTGTWDGHDTPEKYRRLAAIEARAPRGTTASLYTKLPDGTYRDATYAEIVDAHVAGGTWPFPQEADVARDAAQVMHENTAGMSRALTQALEVRKRSAAGPDAMRKALLAILQCDDDARAAQGKAGAGLNGYGLVDLFDSVGHPFGAGLHKQQPYRSVSLDAAIEDARRAITTREARTSAGPDAEPDMRFRLRIARLLAELHGEEALSEQQCARYMDIDLVSWRKLEHCFSAGTSFVEGEDLDFPQEDSESVLRAALALTGPDSKAACLDRGGAAECPKSSENDRRTAAPAPTERHGAGEAWLLELMGKHDFTVPHLAFGALVRKLTATTPQVASPAPAGWGCGSGGADRRDAQGSCGR